MKTTLKKLTPQIYAMYLGCRVLYCEPEGVEYEGKLVGVQMDEEVTRVFILQDSIPDYPEDQGTTIELTTGFIEILLRPLSSMTKEENKELYCGSHIRPWHPAAFVPAEFQWLLAHSFDVYNLIPDGLALELDKAKKV